MKTPVSYLGSDVAKRTLHLANAEKFLSEYDNTLAGVEKLVRRIIQLNPLCENFLFRLQVRPIYLAYQFQGTLILDSFWLGLAAAMSRAGI